MRKRKRRFQAVIKKELLKKRKKKRPESRLKIKRIKIPPPMVA
jgi:hypothetical protein